jgi:hypothetical protein
MKKAGHPLAALREVPEPLVQKLHQELSVTTIEEFLDLASRNGPQLQSFLELDDSEWSRVLERSRESLSPAELEESFRQQSTDYPFRTGHDAPPDTKLAGKTKREETVEDEDD